MPQSPGWRLKGHQTSGPTWAHTCSPSPAAHACLPRPHPSSPRESHGLSELHFWLQPVRPQSSGDGMGARQRRGTSSFASCRPVPTPTSAGSGDLGARRSTPGSCWVDEGTAVSPTSAGRTAPSPLASRDGKPVPGNADQCTASEGRRTRGRSTSRRPRGLEEQRWQSVCSPTPGQQSADGGPVTQQS